MKKDILFLDTSWVADAFGRNEGDTERFVQILDSLNDAYDVRITDRVYEESVSDVKYPKDATFKKWLEDNNVEKIVTQTPPGRDAGELSIVEVMDKNPALAQAKIASHDVNFLDAEDASKGGHAYAGNTVTLQDTLKKLVLHADLPEAVYQDLSENGSPNLRGGWEGLAEVKAQLSSFMGQQAQATDDGQKKAPQQKVAPQQKTGFSKQSNP